MARKEYTLNELTEAADVSARTVRYYIAEGLLPPPNVAGPRSSYSQSHLQRLLLIGRLKDAYLPLREIRRRLDGLDDAEIDAMLHQTEQLDDLSRMTHPMAVHEDAASYISRALGASPVRHERAYSLPAHPAGEDIHYDVGDEVARDADDTVPLSHYAPEEQDEAAFSGEGIAWRRIALGPDAELLIREDTYHRKRDRVDWLIGWAKRVFR